VAGDFALKENDSNLFAGLIFIGSFLSSKKKKQESNGV
jgi:hypothetical protein